MAARAFNVVIVGGHGNVSLRLARLLTARPSTAVTSIIRSQEHTPDIQAAGATPLLLSLEDAPVSQLADAFKTSKADVVYFSAGAGGKGGEERTKKVDEEGAIKVFDAIESLGASVEERPRLILVSAIDIRDPSKGYPAHYNEDDIQHSLRIRKAIPAYVEAKYNADKNLASRTGFRWTILRPGGLTNEPGTGKGHIGKAHLSRTISRDDVAKTLYLLLEHEDAHGLGIDLVGGEEPLENGLSAFIKKGESDFVV
ncbi:NADH(P)-binding-domain-containing protein [Irpex rosettiformis]|uniref:NADH(P)-binding-domain-containing protein n=1 Tax=Irpex rosettiformis TaxID=378272 RepID=A0ACB8TT63_9APHY|nr:NADH(P)-binding-domain-containing protein [Irpex rosettiformis]